MTRFQRSRETECLTSKKKACLPYFVTIPRQKERAFRPFLFTTLRYAFDLGDAQQGDGCLTGHAITVASLTDFAQPSSVSTLAAPAERRLSLGPSCLQSIARNTAMEKSGKVKVARRRLPGPCYLLSPTDASFCSSFCFPCHRPCAHASGGEIFVRPCQFLWPRRWFPWPACC